jgi:hypothetical protein
LNLELQQENLTETASYVETSNSSPAIPALDAIPEKKTDEIKQLTETDNFTTATSGCSVILTASLV